MAGEVTERDRVDTALDAAREAAKTIPDQGAMLAALVQVRCAEAIVRQIRDLDDDVFHLGRTLEASFGDLGIIIGGQS